MTAQSDLPHITVLADHSLLLAIPAFAPAVVVVGVVVYVAMRDRRRDRGHPHSDQTETTGQDETP